MAGNEKGNALNLILNFRTSFLYYNVSVSAM